MKEEVEYVAGDGLILILESFMSRAVIQDPEILGGERQHFLRKAQPRNWARRRWYRVRR